MANLEENELLGIILISKSIDPTNPFHNNFVTVFGKFRENMCPESEYGYENLSLFLHQCKFTMHRSRVNSNGEVDVNRRWQQLLVNS